MRPTARSGRRSGGARSIELGPLTRSIGYMLRRAQITAVAGFLEALKEVELRPTQFAVLLIIRENPGIRQTEFCDALGIQKANFVPLLSHLEWRGLAERRTGTSDRRSCALYLTPRGQELLRRACVLHDAHEARLTARIGKRGREVLLSLLRKLHDPL